MKIYGYRKVDTKEQSEIYDETNMEDCKEVDKPTAYTGFRCLHMTEAEIVGVNRLMDMMIAAKQQIVLRRALRHK